MSTDAGTQTALTFDDAAARFGITARKVEDIINMSVGDELDEATMTITASGVAFIERALAGQAAHEARIAAAAAPALAWAAKQAQA